MNPISTRLMTSLATFFVLAVTFLLLDLPLRAADPGVDPTAVRLPIKQDGKWGYINGKGEPVIAPTWDQVWPFSGDRARVEQDGKFGFIDLTGQVAVPIKFAQAQDFSENLAAVAILEQVLAPRDELSLDDLLPPEQQDPTKKPAPIERWGYIGPTGEWAIPPRYEALGPFSGGLAAALSPTMGREWGYVDRDGTFRIVPQFREAFPFDGDLARARTGDGLTYINRAGEPVGDRFYEVASTFSSGLAAVFRLGQVAESESMAGQLFADTPLDAATMSQRVRTLEGGTNETDTHLDEEIGYGYIDAKFQYVVKPRYDLGYAFSDGLARVVVKGLYGYLRPDGQMAIAPEYEDAQDFHDGLAAVRQKGVWIYIDTTGKRAFNQRFDRASSFRDGYATVQVFEDTLWIDRTGKQIWPAE